jgi:hypothetical protein
MKNLLAIGLACCLPTALSAEDPAVQELAMGDVNVLVIEDSAPIAQDVMCARGAGDKVAGDCVAVHRAVLTVRTQKVSTLQGRGRWM